MSFSVSSQTASPSSTSLRYFRRHWSSSRAMVWGGSGSGCEGRGVSPRAPWGSVFRTPGRALSAWASRPRGDAPWDGLGLRRGPRSRFNRGGAGPFVGSGSLKGSDPRCRPLWGRSPSSRPGRSAPASWPASSAVSPLGGVGRSSSRSSGLGCSGGRTSTTTGFSRPGRREEVSLRQQVEEQKMQQQ